MSTRILDLARLTKPGVTTLVVATCVTGWVIAPGSRDPFRGSAVGVGTWLLVGAANALNMWLERDLDARMVRTRDRPLAKGSLDPRAAIVFAIACALAGLSLLAIARPLAAALGGFAFVVYVAVYTPLKPRSCLALAVGAIPGAIPPVMGWTAKTGSFGREAAILFVTLFLWQFVHAGAIGVFRAEEYAAAGMKVVAVERGERVARALVTVHAALLVVVTLLAPSFGLGGTLLRASAAVLGGALLAAVLFRTQDARVWSRRVFAVSNAYLFALLLASLVDAS